MTAREAASSGALAALLKTAPTPFYLYDEKSLAQAAQTLFTSFSRKSGFLPLFPMEMNPNTAVLRCLRRLGCGVQCRTLRELRLAVRCGFAPERVLYSPLRPDEQAASFAAEYGAALELCAPELLPAQLPQTVFLRLRPAGPLFYDGRPVTGVRETDWGLTEEELLRCTKSLHAFFGVQIGLSMHLTELCMDALLYPACAQTLVHAARRLLDETGIRAAALDLGGGLGVSYRASFPAPDPACAARDVDEALAALPPELADLELRIRPGRFLAAPCGIFVTRVTAVRPFEPPVVLLDYAQTQCPRLAKRGTYHEAAILRAAGRPMCAQRLCGSGQELAGTQYVLPEARSGDAAVFFMLGADGHSLAGTYGGAADCAEYFLRADGTFEPSEHADDEAEAE